MTDAKDQQIKELQFELKRTADYAVKVTRERDAAIKKLKFYANESIYEIDYDPNTGHTSEAITDCGKKAREIDSYGCATIPHLG